MSLCYACHSHPPRPPPGSMRTTSPLRHHHGYPPPLPRTAPREHPGDPPRSPQRRLDRDLCRPAKSTTKTHAHKNTRTQQEPTPTHRGMDKDTVWEGKKGMNKIRGWEPPVGWAAKSQHSTARKQAKQPHQHCTLYLSTPKIRPSSQLREVDDNHGTTHSPCCSCGGSGRLDAACWPRQRPAPRQCRRRDVLSGCPGRPASARSG